jgi:hypothetical protein
MLAVRSMSEEIVVEKSNPLRRRAIEGAVGTLVGLVIACLGGPQLVSFLYKPPSGDAFNCAGTVSEALSYFIRLQLTAGLIGGALLLTSSFLVRRMWKKRREARAAAT